MIRQGRVSPEEREAERQRREKLRQQRSQARQKKAEEERERLLRSSERRQRRAARREKRRLERKKAKEKKTRQKAEALMSAAAAPKRNSWLDNSWLSHLNRQPKAPAFLRERLTTFSRKVDRLRQERSRKRWLDVVGLDIGASAIRAALFRPGREPFLIEREIPEGIIIDGILAEPEELSEELKAMWKENQMPSRKVNFSFANRLVAVRAISLPAQNSEDIEQAIALNAAPIVSPMNPETTVIDYAELSRSGPQVSLQVGAADIEMSRAFLEAIEDAGLWAASAELGPLALNRSLVVPRSASSSHGIIDIGAETTKVSVASGPDIFFVRVLETGGNDFTRALAERTGRGWAAAEELKYRSGVGPEPVDPKLPRAEFERCREAMQTVCDSLCQEVLQAQVFFERSESGKRLPVSGYTLIGGGSRLAGIGEQMAFLLGRPVADEIRPWPGLEEFDLALWSPALGLARDHKMSLLPPRPKRGISRRRRESKISADRAEDRAKELAPKRKDQLVNPWLAGMVLFALVILGSFLLGGKLQEDAADNRVKTASIEQVEAVSRQATGEAEAEAIINLVTDSPNWVLLEKATEQAGLLGNRVESIETRAGTVYVYLQGRSSARELRQTIGLEDDIQIDDLGNGAKLLVVDGGTR